MQQLLQAKEEGAMSGQWHITRNGERLGPYSWNDIVQMCHQRKVLKTDQFWNPNESNWITTSQLYDLMMMDEKNYPNDSRLNFLSSERDCKLLFFVSMAILCFILLVVFFCLLWKSQSCIAQYSFFSSSFALLNKWCPYFIA